jgi:hypothetical protein
VDIQEQISAALAGRASQRDFVDNLAGRWTGLTASFNALISSVAELARAAAASQAPDSTRAAVFDGIRGYVGIGGDWQQRAAALSGELGQGAERIAVLRQRVHRETVNIGVIGVTGAGKSTLLRKLSGLEEQQIPSNRFASSTATPSRIFHDSGSGQGRAVLNLHTWPTFREEVLQPLHEKAGLAAPAPASIEEFRQFPYPREVQEYKAGAERYIKRLRDARDSLLSYESIMRGGTSQITLDRLRPFVAYPADDSSRERPYHAVRSIDIYCQFPEVGAVRLGLVDLPGSGEAGLDVHKRFLADLRNNTDLLFIVRRPVKSPSTEQDWDAAQLADDAAAGVRRRDFAHLVINQDTDLPEEYFDLALARAGNDSTKLGIDIRACDIENSEPPQVAEAILAPILNHVAERLAFMDRDAVAFVLTGLSDVAAEVRTLCRDLDRQFGGWQDKLPDEEMERRRRIRQLKFQVGWELDQVRNEYDRLYSSEEPIAELHQQIAEAGREVRQWLAAGLGAGSRENWIVAFQKAMAASSMGEELDRQYNGARKKVVEVFDKIDASLALAIERLYGEVAAALRGTLTGKLVPSGADHGAALSRFLAIAQGHKAGMLASATKRLLSLGDDYGSIFLRVGRPVVRRIEWYSDAQQPAAVGPAAGLADQAMGVAGPAAGRIVGRAVAGTAGEAVGQAVGEAVSSAIHKRTGQAATGRGSWLSDHVPGPTATRPGTVAPPAAGPTRPASSPAVRPAGSAPAAEQYPDATRWYERLSATIEDVTSELEREFHGEAQRAQRVLAAAVDLYKDSATTAPDIDVEFDRVSSLAQSEIWPQEFGEASAKITADIAALREQVHVTEAAADQLALLADQATRL